MATDQYIGLRFRAISDWCVSRAVYTAGWPNFHAATYHNPTRTVYGHYLLREAVVDWRDVPAREYGANDMRSRFTGAHDYAQRQGYQHGFPNLHQADYGQGVVYGTFLIVPGTCEWRDVPAHELGLSYGDPSRIPMDRWFTGAANYAGRHGYVAAMPTGYCANYGQGWVCGVFLFPPGKAEWVDIRGRELGLHEASPPPRQVPKQPQEPQEPPQPTKPLQLYLDYNARRRTRIGRSQGPWGDASITSVVNKTDWEVELAIHVNNVVEVSAIIGPGNSTNAFNGRHPTADWVGVGATGLEAALGPFEIHYRRKE